ncbi:MAG TPA: hypothetical protein VI199_00680 [Novosphingobium sp.]
MKAIRVSPQVLSGLLPIGLLAACVAPAPSPASAPVAAAPVPPPAAAVVPAVASGPADWRDASQTPGAWRWGMTGGRSTASYAVPGRPPVATLACDLANRTTILWTSSAVAGPVPLVVTTTSLRRVLTASPVPTGGAAARLAAVDPLLDAMAFSRGRFMLESGGSAPLYLPAWPELSRVIEDCRSG